MEFFKFKTRTIAALVLLCTVFVTAGCEKWSRSKTIRFTAATAVERATDTRTAYSGSVSEGRERIDWVTGDVIRLASDKAQTEGGLNYADYVIADIPVPSGLHSITSLGASGDDGLQWGEGQGSYQFWSIYPSHAITLPAGTVEGLSIPATQDVIAANKTESSTLTSFAPDMSSAWMLAYKAGVTEGASDFTLDFYPAFTAFEFTLKSKDEATLTVKSFTLSSTSTDLAGTFDVTAIADGGASTFGNFASGSSSVSVSFGAGVDVTQTKSLTFTVLALPQVLSNLSITFNIEKGGVASYRTLALKYADSAGGAYIDFAPCKKHRITGLSLPGGSLMLSALTVSAWDQVTTSAVDYSYEYTSPSAAKIKALEPYRRYDTDNDFSSWETSSIVVSYGYMNHEGDVVITDTPGSDLRSAFSPVIELLTESESNTVLRLVLDNPNFKFIQYDNAAASSSDHLCEDAIEILSGPNVQTFFSVVPRKQFRIDAPESEKKCTVSLLSVESGTFHEMPFNNSGAPDYHRLPGESPEELVFYYVGPALFESSGSLCTPDGSTI